MTVPTSIYPHAIEALMPQAQLIAEQVGGIPSRNRLMRELRIGPPKASELRAALIALRDDTNGIPAPNTRPEPTAPVQPTAPVVEATPVEVSPVEPAGEPDPQPVTEPDPQPAPPPVIAIATAQAAVDEYPGTEIRDAAPVRPVKARRPVRSWPVYLIALPAAIAIWAGWVGLGQMTGFGMVDLLPGIVDPGGWATIDSAITLPIGVEAYAAYALKAWLSGTSVPLRARRFARTSAIGSLLVGSLGQIAYHLMQAQGMTAAPWWITTLVSCLPVVVLGMGAALAHLLNSHDEEDGQATA